MFRKSLRPQPETAHRHEYWSRYAQSPLWPAARQKGATLYPPHLERSVRLCRSLLMPSETTADINDQWSTAWRSNPGGRCTGAIIVSNLKEANQQKRISLSPSDGGCGHRGSRQRSPRAARVPLNEMLELIPYSPQPQPVEKAASLTDLLPNLHLLLRSADLLPSAGSSF